MEVNEANLQSLAVATKQCWCGHYIITAKAWGGGCLCNCDLLLVKNCMNDVSKSEQFEVPSLTWDAVSGAYESCHLKFAARQCLLSCCWLASPCWNISSTQGPEQEAVLRQDPPILLKARSWQCILEKQTQPCLTSSSPSSLASNLLPHFWHLSSTLQHT